MADKTNEEHLIEIAQELSRVVLEDRAFLRALFDYLRGQPAFDEVRLRTLIAQQRTDLGLDDPNRSIDAIQQFLRADVPGWLQ